MFSKSGQGISMTYIVIAALALMVLIVIFLFFTGALGEMFSRQTEVVEASAEDKAVWVSQCKLHCSLEKNERGNCPNFCGVKFEKDGKVYSCRGSVAGSESLEVDCNVLVRVEETSNSRLPYVSDKEERCDC